MSTAPCPPIYPTMLPSIGQTMRDGLPVNLQTNWAKDPRLREINFDTARYALYGLYPEMFPSGPQIGYQRIQSLSADAHRLPFWPTDKPPRSLDKTIAVLVSVDNIPHVPYSEFLDAVLSRLPSPPTPLNAGSSSHLFYTTPTSQELPTVDYQVASEALLDAPGLFERAHPPVSAGGIDPENITGQGVRKLQNMVITAIDHLRSTSAEEDVPNPEEELSMFTNVMVDVISGMKSTTQFAACSRTNVERLYQQEQSGFRRLKIRRGMVLIMGVVLTSMFHGLVTMMPTRVRREKKDKNVKDGTKQAASRARSVASSLDKTTSMYAFSFHAFSECVIFAKSGMYEIRAGFDFPAVQEASAWRRRHAQGRIPADATPLPRAIEYIECIIRSAARYLVVHSCALPWESFQPVFDSVIEDMMRRCFAIVNAHDRDQKSSIGLKRQHNFITYQFDVRRKKRRTHEAGVDNDEASDSGDDQVDDEMIYEGIHQDYETQVHNSAAQDKQSDLYQAGPSKLGEASNDSEYPQDTAGLGMQMTANGTDAAMRDAAFALTELATSSPGHPSGSTVPQEDGHITSQIGFDPHMGIDPALLFARPMMYQAGLYPSTIWPGMDQHQHGPPPEIIDIDETAQPDSWFAESQLRAMLDISGLSPENALAMMASVQSHNTSEHLSALQSIFTYLEPFDISKENAGAGAEPISTVTDDAVRRSDTSASQHTPSSYPRSPSGLDRPQSLAIPSNLDGGGWNGYSSPGRGTASAGGPAGSAEPHDVPVPLPNALNAHNESSTSSTSYSSSETSFFPGFNDMSHGDTVASPTSPRPSTSDDHDIPQLASFPSTVPVVTGHLYLTPIDLPSATSEETPQQAVLDPPQPVLPLDRTRKLRPRPEPASQLNSRGKTSDKTACAKSAKRKRGRRNRRKGSSDTQDGNDEGGDEEDSNVERSDEEGAVPCKAQPLFRERHWFANPSPWGSFQELPPNWFIGRTPSLVPMIPGMEDVLVYGKDAKEALIKLSQADPKLLHDEEPGQIDHTVFIHPASDPFSTPETPESALEIERVHRLIEENLTKPIVIRAVGSRRVAGEPSEQSDLEKSSDFPTQFLSVFADPDTLVDVQVCDVNFGRTHEPVQIDIDSPDTDLFDVEACAERLRGQDEEETSEIEYDPLDGMGSLFTMPVRQVSYYLRHLRTAGCNVVSGVRTTPCRRMEVMRRLTCDFDKAANVTARFGLAPIDQFGVNFTLYTGAGTYTGPHVDANGLNTGVHIVDGEKLWLIREPLVVPMSQDFRRMKDRDFMITAVRLCKGDTLIMPPGTIHEVLTTKDCVATGGHFIAQQTLLETLVWSTRLAGSYSDATNATHNGVVLAIFDAYTMRRLQPVYFEITWFLEHAELSSTAAQTLEANLDLIKSDFALWMVGILFSDEILPRTEDRQGVNSTDEKKHQLVRDHVLMFLRLVDQISPSCRIIRTIFDAACIVFDTALQGCSLRETYGTTYIIERLQVLFQVSLDISEDKETECM